MPTTRAMARKGSDASEDKENEVVLNLRKKPIRRATAKAAAAKQQKKVALAEPKAAPLSPKKVTQVARGRSAQVEQDSISETPAAAGAKPKRPIRSITKSSTRSRPVSRLASEEADETMDIRRFTQKLSEVASGCHETRVSESETTHFQKNLSSPNLAIRTRRNGGTPMVPTSVRTRSKAHLQESEDELIAPTPTAIVADDDSDDELCGPKTPMRRKVPRCAKQDPDREGVEGEGRPMETRTPARRFKVHRSGRTPQTQKVPVKSPGPASPQRPMTVARGSSVVYTFHSLPRPEPQCSSPSHENIEEPALTGGQFEDFSEDAEDEDAIVEFQKATTQDQLVTQSVRRSPFINRTPLAREPLQTDFAKVSDAESEEDEVDTLFDDEIDNEINEDPSFSASVNEIESEDGLSEPDLPMFDGMDQEEQRPGSSHPGNDETSASVAMPDVHSSVLHFSPEQPVPDPYGLEDDAANTTNDLSAPTVQSLANFDELDFTDLDIEHLPVSRPNVLGEIQESDNRSMDNSSTPRNGRAYEKSLTDMFKTPHMRTALDEFETQNTFGLSPSTATSAAVNLPNVACLDPALLDNCYAEFNNASTGATPFLRKLSLSETPASTVPGWPNLKAPLTTSNTTESPIRDRTARLSLLINSDGLCDSGSEHTPQHNHVSSKLAQATTCGRGFEENNDTIASTVKEVGDLTVSPLGSAGGSINNVNHTLETVPAPVLSVDDVSAASPIQEIEEAAAREEEEKVVPHYARSTLAFDSRRQSMPAFGLQTPQNTALRPRIVDTNVKPGTNDTFAKLWIEKQHASKQVHDQRLRRRSSMGPSQLNQVNTPQTSRPASPALVRTTSTMNLRGRQNEHPLRHSTLSIDHVPTTPLYTPRPRSYTPTCFLTRSASMNFRTESPDRSPAKLSMSSPARQPVMSPAKSPTKAAIKAPIVRSPVKARLLSPSKSAFRSPTKTPLKFSAESPALYPFTPHPAQPLRTVLALVEIFTLDGSDASRSFVASLHRLGARTTKTWSERVTHVIFKDGSPTTLQKVRVANKDSAGTRGREVHCVNSRWVTDCDREGMRMDEHAEEYAVDVTEVPRDGHRRRKSMEPAALQNIEGNVVATPAGMAKKLSLNRISMGRLSLASTAWGDSPVKGAGDSTSGTNATSRDVHIHSDDSLSDFATPDSGGIRTEDDLLVQQTMPVNKVKRFKLKELDQAARRRLTTWDITE